MCVYPRACECSAFLECPPLRENRQPWSVASRVVGWSPRSNSQLGRDLVSCHLPERKVCSSSSPLHASLGITTFGGAAQATEGLSGGAGRMLEWGRSQRSKREEELRKSGCMSYAGCIEAVCYPECIQKETGQRFSVHG